jgi:hypothetical protein
VLRSLVRPGGVLAFQEVSWRNQLSQTAHLPLRMAVMSLAHDTIARSGARTNNELFLYRHFRAAGLPPPTLRNELMLGSDPEIRRYLCDLLFALWPKAEENGLPRAEIGDLDTLAARLDAELDANEFFAASCGVVGALSRRP